MCQFVGPSCGHHGSYTFYRAFRYRRSRSGECHSCSLNVGSFFFARVLPRSPICIGELQLLWENKKTVGTKLASVKLYFTPEDTPDGRQPQHGEDELLVFDEKIVLEIGDLVKWIVDIPVNWSYGFITSGDHSKDTPSSDLELFHHGVGNSSNSNLQTLNDCQVRIVSYTQYCRYRAIVKRLEGDGGVSKWLRNVIVQTIGGLSDATLMSRVMFCRDTFIHPDLISHDFKQDQLAPKLKGRKRRKNPMLFDPSISNNNSCCNSSSATFEKTRNQNSCTRNPGRSIINSSGLDLKNCGKELFEKELFKFMREKKTPIKRIPSLGFKEVDLFQFYGFAQKLGGYDKVTDGRHWKQIYDQLGGHSGNTSAATCTRRIYEKLLLTFERHVRGEDDKPLPVTYMRPARKMPSCDLMTSRLLTSDPLTSSQKNKDLVCDISTSTSFESQPIGKLDTLSLTNQTASISSSNDMPCNNATCDQSTNLVVDGGGHVTGNQPIGVKSSFVPLSCTNKPDEQKQTPPLSWDQNELDEVSKVSSCASTSFASLPTDNIHIKPFEITTPVDDVKPPSMSPPERGSLQDDDDANNHRFILSNSSDKGTSQTISRRVTTPNHLCSSERVVARAATNHVDLFCAERLEYSLETMTSPDGGDSGNISAAPRCKSKDTVGRNADVARTTVSGDVGPSVPVKEFTVNKERTAEPPSPVRLPALNVVPPGRPSSLVRPLYGPPNLIEQPFVNGCTVFPVGGLLPPQTTSRANPEGQAQWSRASSSSDHGQMFSERSIPPTFVPASSSAVGKPKSEAPSNAANPSSFSASTWFNSPIKQFLEQTRSLTSATPLTLTTATSSSTDLDLFKRPLYETDDQPVDLTMKTLNQSRGDRSKNRSDRRAAEQSEPLNLSRKRASPNGEEGNSLAASKKVAYDGRVLPPSPRRQERSAPSSVVAALSPWHANAIAIGAAHLSVPSLFNSLRLPPIVPQNASDATRFSFISSGLSSLHPIFPFLSIRPPPPPLMSSSTASHQLLLRLPTTAVVAALPSPVISSGGKIGV